MIAESWSGADLSLLVVCAATGLLALAFFGAIFLADAKEARQRARAKQSFKRARKFFARNRK
jgi:hypothetical protein